MRAVSCSRKVPELRFQRNCAKEQRNIHNLVESGNRGFQWKRFVTELAKSSVFHGPLASFSPKLGSLLSSGSSAPGIRNILDRDVFHVQDCFPGGTLIIANGGYYHHSSVRIEPHPRLDDCATRGLPLACLEPCFGCCHHDTDRPVDVCLQIGERD